MLFSAVYVIILSVSGVLSEQTWGVTYSPERICALKGSAVDMRCTYSYPPHHTVQKISWLTKYQPGSGEPEDLSQDPEYSHRVESLCNQNSDCTFRINQLRKSDSGTYHFRFWTNYNNYTGGPGVMLTVTDLQLMVNPHSVTERQSVMLTCSTTCTLTGSPAFIWYRDGSPLSFTAQTHQFTTSWEDAGSYTCAVRGYEHLPSPAVALNVRYSPKNTSVLVSPSGDVVGGISVTLTCSSEANPPVQRYTFTKRYRSNQKQNGHRSSYIIEGITLWDAGEYYCGAANSFGTGWSPPVNLKVLCLKVEINPDSAREGEMVTLTCKNTCTSTSTFEFYKDEQVLSNMVDNQFIARSDNTGYYSCRAIYNMDLSSNVVLLRVKYSPKNTSVSVSPSGDVVEGSSVTLTCSSDANPPVQRYTWFKENDTGVWQAGSGQILNVSNFKSWNSGQYYCESKNRHGAQNSSALWITVQGGQSLITAAAVGTAAILALACLGAVWVRRRKSTSETVDRQGNSSPVYANVPGTGMRRTATQGTDRDSGGDPLYSSLQPVNQDENMYHTLGPSPRVRRMFSKPASPPSPPTQCCSQGNSSPVYANVPGTAMRRTATQGTDRDDGGDPLYSSLQPVNQEENLYHTLHRPLPLSEKDVQ